MKHIVCFLNIVLPSRLNFKSALYIPSPTLELDPPLVSNLFFLKSKQSFLSLNSYLLFYFTAFPMPGLKTFILKTFKYFVKLFRRGAFKNMLGSKGILTHFVK